jgi:hypothetical protein
MATFFSDFFAVDPDDIETYGAFNVSLVNDLPLFIDPFLLFHSDKTEYQILHREIIKYLVFLRDKSIEMHVSTELLISWYCFSEVRQNWLGFSVSGNSGSGLGLNFATALNENLSKLFSEFGSERVTEGSHLEKVCLIRPGVGKDNISDFTTNLIKDFLCRYAEDFARGHLRLQQVKLAWVPKAKFNYSTQSWER